MKLVLNYSFLHHVGIYSMLIYASWNLFLFPLRPIYNFQAGGVKVDRGYIYAFA